MFVHHARFTSISALTSEATNIIQRALYRGAGRASLSGPLYLCLALLLLRWESSHIDRFGPPVNESAAVGSLRTLYSANASYAKSHPQQGYPKKLSDLSTPSGLQGGEETTWAIDAALAKGTRAGYRFTYTPSSSSGDEKWTNTKLFRTH
jgi:hypothetical protein